MFDSAFLSGSHVKWRVTHTVSLLHLEHEVKEQQGQEQRVVLKRTLFESHVSVLH